MRITRKRGLSKGSSHEGKEARVHTEEQVGLLFSFSALRLRVTVMLAIVLTIGLPRRAHQDWKALWFQGIIGFLRGFVSFR